MSQAQGNAPSLVDKFERYCLESDGNHEMTWNVAVHDGYAELSEADFADLRLPGASQLRGYERTDNGTVYRILTASNRQYGNGEEAFFRACWVSSSDDKLSETDRDLRRLLKVPHFRFEQTFLYAWIPLPDGSNQTVRRRDFNDHYRQLANEQGLRYATSRQFGRGVFIGYVSPRDEASYKLAL